MSTDALGDLTRQLREAPPAGVGALADEHLDHLSGALRAARRRQAEQIESTSEQALSRLPRLLRGPVKKIVG